MQCLPTLSTANFAHSMFVLLYSCHHVAHRFYYRTFFDVSTSNSGARGFRVSFTRKKGNKWKTANQGNEKLNNNKKATRLKKPTQTKLIGGPTIAIHRNKLKLKHLTTDRQRKCDEYTSFICIYIYIFSTAHTRYRQTFQLTFLGKNFHLNWF